MWRRWYRDNGLMQQEISLVSPFIRPLGNALQLLRPQASDTGRYICVANNPLGEDRRDVSSNWLFPELSLGAGARGGGGGAIIPFNLRRQRPFQPIISTQTINSSLFLPILLMHIYKFSAFTSSIIRDCHSAMKAPSRNISAEQTLGNFWPRPLHARSQFSRRQQCITVRPFISTAWTAELWTWSRESSSINFWIDAPKFSDGRLLSDRKNVVMQRDLLIIAANDHLLKIYLDWNIHLLSTFLACTLLSRPFLWLLAALIRTDILHNQIVCDFLTLK